MDATVRRFRMPVWIRFLLWADAALVLLIGALQQLNATIEWWGGPETAPNLTQGWPAIVCLVILFGLSAFLVWRAVRAYPRRS